MPPDNPWLRPDRILVRCAQPTYHRHTRAMEDRDPRKARPSRPVVEPVGTFDEQIVATSVHAGHDLRPEIAAAMILPEDVRFREEDPFTDVIASAVNSRFVTHRSRFEVDLNRPIESAVYRKSGQGWKPRHLGPTGDSTRDWSKRNREPRGPSSIPQLEEPTSMRSPTPGAPFGGLRSPLP